MNTFLSAALVGLLAGSLASVASADNKTQPNTTTPASVTATTTKSDPTTTITTTTETAEVKPMETAEVKPMKANAKAKAKTTVDCHVGGKATQMTPEECTAQNGTVVKKDDHKNHK